MDAINLLNHALDNLLASALTIYLATGLLLAVVALKR